MREQVVRQSCGGVSFTLRSATLFILLSVIILGCSTSPTGPEDGDSRGVVAAWGWNEVGQCDVPSPNYGFVAIAGSAGVSLGLREDGSIAAWGAQL